MDEIVGANGTGLCPKNDLAPVWSAGTGPADQTNEGIKIALLVENLGSAVAAIEHVIAETGSQRSGGAWHAQQCRSSRLAWQELN